MMHQTLASTIGSSAMLFKTVISNQLSNDTMLKSCKPLPKSNPNIKVMEVNVHETNKKRRINVCVKF